MTIDRDPSTPLAPVTDFHLPAIGMLVAPLGLAAIAGTIFIGGLVGWDPLWPADRATLAEAVVLRDRGAAAQLLRDGANPNAKYRVRADILDSTPRVLTPLEAAVAINSSEMVEYLLQGHAVPDAAERTRLGCLALRLRNPGLLPTLGLKPDALDCASVQDRW